MMVDDKSDIDGAEEIAVDADAEIKRLAALRIIEYERERKEAAERLGISRVSILDKLVEAERPQETNNKQGRALKLFEPEPWPDPVDGAVLLDDITNEILRYLALPDHAAEAMALWAIHTYCTEAAFVSPRLVFTSPQMRCGKTTALYVMRPLLLRALSTSGLRGAGLFRTVEMARPSFLLDEADAFAKDNDELRGLINSSYQKDEIVIRVVSSGDDLEPRAFNLFCPMAIASIGKLADTIEDRAVIIKMRRATRAERKRLQKFRLDRPGRLTELARMIARWANDHVEALKELDPDMPAKLNDRATDNWRLLISIADIAGRDWPGRARIAALHLSGDDEGKDETVDGLLFADLAAYLVTYSGDNIKTACILAYLHSLEDRPWPYWGRARKPMNANQLGNILRPYDVRPNTLRNGVDTAKGYKRNDLESVFARYGDVLAVTPSQPAENSGKLAISGRHKSENVTAGKSPKPAETLGCDGVTAGNGGSGVETPFSGQNGPSEEDDIEREAIMLEAGFADIAVPTKSGPAPDEPQTREVKWTL